MTAHLSPEDREECTNEWWAAENGTTVEWARSMWWCDCSVCVAWPGVLA